MTAAAKDYLKDLRPADQRERFRDPLEFIYAEHYRNRVISNTLDAAVPSLRPALSPAELNAIIRYYTVDRPLHIQDEEEALFPLLRRRCRESDNLPEILALLEAEHRDDDALIESVLYGLMTFMRDGGVDDPDLLAARSHAMADSQRRHLAWENSVVMPLAKKRLTASDLVELARAMAARRGIDLDGK